MNRYRFTDKDIGTTLKFLQTGKGHLELPKWAEKYQDDLKIKHKKLYYKEKLIVSRETRQWGTDYDPSRDFGRTSLGRRPLTETTQSLALTLEPNLGGESEAIPSGTLRITWGTAEYFTDWQIVWP